MNFVDWFDPHNEEHLLAYRHLQQTGSWPMWFVPQGTMGAYWQMQIAQKLADA